jgi:hypothetical protein
MLSFEERMPSILDITEEASSETWEDSAAQKKT